MGGATVFSGDSLRCLLLLCDWTGVRLSSMFSSMPSSSLPVVVCLGVTVWAFLTNRLDKDFLVFPDKIDSSRDISSSADIPDSSVVVWLILDLDSFISSALGSLWSILSSAFRVLHFDWLLSSVVSLVTGSSRASSLMETWVSVDAICVFAVLWARVGRDGRTVFSSVLSLMKNSSTKLISFSTVVSLAGVLRPFLARDLGTTRAFSSSSASSTRFACSSSGVALSSTEALRPFPARDLGVISCSSSSGISDKVDCSTSGNALSSTGALRPFLTRVRGTVFTSSPSSDISVRVDCSTSGDTLRSASALRPFLVRGRGVAFLISSVDGSPASSGNAWRVFLVLVRPTTLDFSSSEDVSKVLRFFLVIFALGPVCSSAPPLLFLERRVWLRASPTSSSCEADSSADTVELSSPTSIGEDPLVSLTGRSTFPERTEENERKQRKNSKK